MENHIKTAERLSKLMDEQFEAFGIKFGLDPIFGLLPGIGDILPFALGSYQLWIAHRLKLPFWQILSIIKNIAVDIIVGAIPVLGDLFDIGYKSHSRNIEIIKKHLTRA